jgi:predicted ATPase
MAEPIIGRRSELKALARFVEAVHVGGRALLIEGEAGIGKTALLHEGVRAARANGFRVLTARAAPAEAQMAFAAIGDLFTPTLEETLPSLAPVQRHALEIALLLREPEGPPPEVRVLGVALVSAVSSLAQEGPLLLALDDVQWVDASSADVLGFMLQRVDGRPVGVLATVRGRPVRAPLDLDRAFAATERLPLEPLSIGAIHRLLMERLSLNLPRPSLVRVHAAAGGNPFYALELGRALVDGTIGEIGGSFRSPRASRASSPTAWRHCPRASARRLSPLLRSLSPRCR